MGGKEGMELGLGGKRELGPVCKGKEKERKRERGRTSLLSAEVGLAHAREEEKACWRWADGLAHWANSLALSFLFFFS